MIPDDCLWTDDLMLWYAYDYYYHILWFKFLYDGDVDIATAMCALKGLAAVKLQRVVSGPEQLRP